MTPVPHRTADPTAPRSLASDADLTTAVPSGAPLTAAGSGVLVAAAAQWPAAGEPAPQGLPGFLGSSFSPLVAAVADRCLHRWPGAPPLPAAVGGRTGIVLASVRGDLPIGQAIADGVDARARLSPLLFFQSVATAVLGHVTARWGLGGPVVCISPVGDPLADALAVGASLLDDGDADAVLVIVAEPGWLPGEHDTAAARLVLPVPPARPLEGV